MKRNISNYQAKTLQYILCDMDDGLERRIRDYKIYMREMNDMLENESLKCFLQHELGDLMEGYASAFLAFVPDGKECCLVDNNAVSDCECRGTKNYMLTQINELKHEIYVNRFYMNKRESQDVGESLAEQDFCEHHLPEWARGFRLAWEERCCPARHVCKHKMEAKEKDVKRYTEDR